MILYLVSSLTLTIETIMKLLPNVPQTGRQGKRIDRAASAQTPRSFLMVLRFFVCLFKRTVLY